MEKSVLSNCLFQCIMYSIFIRGCKIKCYWNGKYKVLSFYLVVRGKYKITFRRDKSRPIVINKLLFYVKPYYSLIV